MTAPQGSFYNHASERLRILGEIPVRKFDERRQAAARSRRQSRHQLPGQDPADIAWTFQTLDKNGMVLNMSQTWHQVRPGEIRTNCGGCHAHSQQPTPFEETAAAKPDYQVWDLTKKTPLLDRARQTTSPASSGTRTMPPGCAWQRASRTWSSIATSSRSWTAAASPATRRSAEKPPGNLVLDDDKPVVGDRQPAHAALGHVLPPGGRPGSPLRPQAGQRLRLAVQQRLALRPHVPVAAQPAGVEDLRPAPGRLDQRRLPDGDRARRRRARSQWKGKPIENTPHHRSLADLDYTGSIMPPPEAVAGTTSAPTARRSRSSRSPTRTA